MTSTRIVTILEFIVYIFIVTLLPSSNADVVGYGMDNITQQFQDFEAEFGTDIGPSGLMGILVNAVPADACKTLKTRPYPPNNENLTINAFVLIARGGCDFAIKVLNAQKASYNAAIVYNLGSDDLLHMGTLYPSIQDQINIPSVFVGQTSGLILNSSYLYFYENNPYVKIREGDAPFSLRYYIYPFIAVIGCSFLVLLLFVGIRAVRDRHRRRRNRLSRQRLKQLPTKQFRKGDEYDVCAICLEEYDEGDTLRLLPCNHAYHCKCVDPWLTSTRRVCPLCKRRVLSDDESTDSDASDDSGDDEEAPLLRPPSSASSEPHFASNQPHRATGYTQENPTLPPRGRGSSHLLAPPTRAYSAPVQFENPILEEFGEDGDDNRSLASTESILPCDDTPHGSACDVTRHACDVTPHLPQSSVDVASPGESLPSPPVASPDHPPFLPPVQDEQRSAKVHEHSPSHEYSCDEEDDVSGDDDDVSYDVIDEEVIDEVQPDDCPPPAPRC